MDVVKTRLKSLRQAVDKANQYATRDRQEPEAQLSAPCGSSGSTQPCVAHDEATDLFALYQWAWHLAGIEVDRKVLADLAVHEPAAFAAIVDQAKGALAQ